MKPLRTLYTNSHYPLTLVYKDSDGNPKDITGYSAKLVLRQSLSSQVAATVSADIDGPNGKISFKIKPDDTAGILGDEFESKFLLGVTLTDTDSETLTLLQTNVLIKENIVPSEVPSA
ncbi:hypothetical protein ALT721_800067 [Alteromonas alvinellae]